MVNLRVHRHQFFLGVLVIMRTLPPRVAKQKAFCTKCDETHEKPVGQQCLQLATTSVTMGDSDASSVSSIPLGQHSQDQVDQASTQKVASEDSQDKLDIILRHIQRLFFFHLFFYYYLNSIIQKYKEQHDQLILQKTYKYITKDETTQ